jgi:hypothetical protein
MNNKLFVVVSFLLILITASPAFAGARKKKATPAQYQAPVISSVTGNTITVSDEKTTRTFIITQFTEINVNGQRAGVADSARMRACHAATQIARQGSSFKNSCLLVSIRG